MPCCCLCLVPSLALRGAERWEPLEWGNGRYSGSILKQICRITMISERKSEEFQPLLSNIWRSSAAYTITNCSSVLYPHGTIATTGQTYAFMLCALQECLHRFCSECITTALMRGNKECPTCRKKIVSKRSLRPDPNFDALISKVRSGSWSSGFNQTLQPHAQPRY